MNSNKYWEKQAEQILLSREKETENYIKRIIKIYNNAQVEIDREMSKIFNTYNNNYNLLEAEAVKLLSTKQTAEHYELLFSRIKETQDKDIKKQLLSMYNAPAYNYRISRLQVLKNNIYTKIKLLADDEITLTKQHYTDVLSKTYSKYTACIDGVKASESINYATITDSVLNKILNTTWAGANFSKRIWKNSELLYKNVENIITTGILTGSSNQKMGKLLADAMDSSIFNATRLIRTETNHFHNEAECQSYINNDIKYYKFLAILDNRTSEICRNLNGKIFEVKNKRTGENFPPMHPFCRSTTVPIDEDETEEYLEESNNNKNIG